MIITRLGKKPLSHIQILYICSRCFHKQAFSYNIVVDNLRRDLKPALSFDTCESCDTYFEIGDAIFMSIEDPKDRKEPDP